MKISDLGENGLVERIAELIASSQDRSKLSWQQLITGIGDDAAVWRNAAWIQLATVDALRQNEHFYPGMMSWADLGWKGLAINLSDIAAMGGTPTYALVSLAVPGTTEVDDVMSLYRSLVELAKQSGVAVIGGDTDHASLIDISITLLGMVPPGKPVLFRSEARPGDLVAVTGYLGTAAAGLAIIAGKHQYAAERAAVLKEAFLRPNPRVSEGQVLAEQGVKAAIDVSDGLVRDLERLCKASNLSARLDVNRVPVHPLVRECFGDAALQMALSGGEDYELLFTASAAVIDRVKKALSCLVTVIGEVTSDKSDKPAAVNAVDREGRPFQLAEKGWDHFARQKSA